MRSTASPSETPGCRLKEMVTDGSCPWWLMVSACGLRRCGDRVERHQLAVGGAHVDAREHGRIGLVFGGDFENHLILAGAAP
jgi:hypothetical protein